MTVELESRRAGGQGVAAKFTTRRSRVITDLNNAQFEKVTI